MNLTIGSLFSGIGGLELGLERAGLGPVVWQVEADPFCRAVLARHWPGAKRYADVRDIGRREESLLGVVYENAGHKLEPVDVICGGFPCQDISLAGRGAGIEGAQSGLWSEYVRIVRELRPRFVAIENVSALVARGLVVVLSDLAACGYDALWFDLRAEDLGAPHRRERLFVVAWRVSDADGRVLRFKQQRKPGRRSKRVCDEGESEPRHVGEAVADRDEAATRATAGIHGDGALRDDAARRDRRASWPPGPEDSAGWEAWIAAGRPEPGIRGSTYGIPGRVDRLGALGNAVVPQCAEVVGHVIQNIAGRLQERKT